MAAPGTASVLHHDGLTELGREWIEHDAGDDIDGAAGGEGHDGPNDLVLGPCVGESPAPQRRRHDRGASERQDSAAIIPGHENFLGLLQHPGIEPEDELPVCTSKYTSIHREPLQAKDSK
jgi:hypothetical protein